MSFLNFYFYNYAFKVILVTPELLSEMNHRHPTFFSTKNSLLYHLLFLGKRNQMELLIFYFNMMVVI